MLKILSSFKNKIIPSPENIPMIINTKDFLSKEFKGDIYLIQQYYQDKSVIRQKEYDYCLQRNLNNKYINKIYLLNEKSNNYEHFENNNKIEEIIINKRLEYYDFFKFIRKLNGYCILSNLDIYFDESIIKIKSGLLGKIKSIYCLTRYNIKNNLPEFFNNKSYCSQDVWIIHTKFNRFKNIDLTRFKLGKPYCDNRILYLLFQEKFKIINDPSKIKCYHYHQSDIRNYHQINDKINGKILHLNPFI